MSDLLGACIEAGDLIPYSDSAQEGGGWILVVPKWSGSSWSRSWAGSSSSSSWSSSGSYVVSSSSWSE